MNYLTASRPPREPQTQPMSVGSAFDAFVKHDLHVGLFGKNHKDSGKFDRVNLFEAQVEPHNREWAKRAGEYVFKCYKECGALADLMLELNKSVSDPRFEMSIEGVVDGSREGVSGSKGGVPLLGKPDLYFINEEGAHCIVDWKVNGFCSKSATSPMPGYIKIRDAFSWNDCKASRGPEMHKDCFPRRFCGMEINGATYLETLNDSWAAQLSTYCWLLGEPVGKEVVCGIDQIVCKPRGATEGYPFLRVATHRSLVSENYQFKILNDYQNLWSILNEKELYFFRDLSFEASKAKCELLDTQAVELYGSAANLTSDEIWLLDAARQQGW
jgi:hypothetical protein